MKIFINVLLNDIKLVLSDWKMLIIIFAMPVLLIVYFSYAIYPILNEETVVQPISIGVVDRDDTIESRILINQLSDIDLIAEINRVSEEDAVTLIDENKIAAAVIVPEGFISSVVSGENKSITILGNAKREQQAIIIRTLVTGASNIVSSGQAVLYSYSKFVNETGIARDELNQEFNALSEDIVMSSLDRSNVVSEIRTYPQDNLTATEHYTASLLALFLLFSAVPVSKLLLVERTSGIASRRETTNLGGSRVLASKLIVSLFVSVFQMSLIFFITSKVFNNYWGAGFFITLAIFLSGIFAVSCWSLFVSVISNNQRQFEVISSMGILFMALIGGSIYPIAKMPNIIRSASTFTINRWIQEGFMKVFSGNRHPDISQEITSLIIIGMFFVVFSTIIYKFKKAG
ncbi:ABC transporter permease [Herbivorax sp. ANBcel31]|uniref:ABC transporter permease n=1 Tax=Herbivorax sp. ANBcel31 TaxID=3069754 RepID=UPI0027B3A967|nr:ABC transporter permease [Herbivorax sp. ANBcel31]MDQ2088119.1 ABC transporter permease [Herbivorax sp. ANBcel31]